MAGEKPTIVIKKIKKAGHGHHGGAWKVAYADFVTAMMAFFLLMWLLNATDDATKRGISNYFSPIGTTNSGAGSGGLFGGRTIQSDGALQDISARPVAGPNFGLSQEKDKASDPSDKKENDEEETKKQEESTSATDNLEKILSDKEEEAFKAAEGELKQAMLAVPELKELAENLLIDVTPEGMRIQLVDQNKRSMFPSGKHIMYDHTYKIIRAVQKVIAKLPNKISIYGHTDGAKFRNSFDYGNWELSSDRAQAARRALVDSGLSPNRIVQVSGKADQDPLFKDNPKSPQNRRISIVLIRQNKKS